MTCWTGYPSITSDNAAQQELQWTGITVDTIFYNSDNILSYSLKYCLNQTFSQLPVRYMTLRQWRVNFDFLSKKIRKDRTLFMPCQSRKTCEELSCISCGVLFGPSYNFTLWIANGMPKKIFFQRKLIFDFDVFHFCSALCFIFSPS